MAQRRNKQSAERLQQARTRHCLCGSCCAPAATSARKQAANVQKAETHVFEHQLAVNRGVVSHHALGHVIGIDVVCGRSGQLNESRSKPAAAPARACRVSRDDGVRAVGHCGGRADSTRRSAGAGEPCRRPRTINPVTGDRARGHIVLRDDVRQALEVHVNCQAGRCQHSQRGHAVRRGSAAGPAHVLAPRTAKPGRDAPALLPVMTLPST